MLYAARPIARRLLQNAENARTAFGVMRIVSTEGLIGFKLQALANDPNRGRDLDDIRELLRQNREALNLTEVREYFRLFEMESLLDELLEETN